MEKKDFALQILNNYIEICTAASHDVDDWLQHIHLTINADEFKDVRVGRRLLNEEDFDILINHFQLYDEMENPSDKIPSRTDWFLQHLHWYLAEILEPNYKLTKSFWRPKPMIQALVEMPVMIIPNHDLDIRKGDILTHSGEHKGKLRVEEVEYYVSELENKPAYVIKVKKVERKSLLGWLNLRTLVTLGTLWKTFRPDIIHFIQCIKTFFQCTK